MIASGRGEDNVGHFWPISGQWKSIPFDIGVVGNSGAGKSSFIIAMLGLYEDDWDAADDEVMKVTKKPTAYSHPRNESFKMWDFPVVEMPNPYLQKIELAKMDFFLIMSSERLNENDAWLASQISAAGKGFCFVRTKVDRDVADEVTSQQSVLRTIRDNLRKNLKTIGFSDVPVFLISNYYTSRYDFCKLEQSIFKDLPDLKKKARAVRIRKVNSDAPFDSNGGVAGIITFSNEKADEWKSTPIDIGLTGNSGAGKSSFINAFLGLYADDPGAAAVGVNEGTKIPTAYRHPQNESVILWDLPGVGTENFPKDSYLQKVEMAKKDFFLIMSSERFKENDAWLATQITAAGKKFYFVRTKVDQDVDNEMEAHYRVKPSEESVLRKIRDHLRENLDSIGSPNARVFLIDNHNKSRFDFETLEAILSLDSPKLNKEALLFSLGNMSDAVLEARIVALRRRAKNASIVSSLIGAVPVRDLSFVLDLRIITCLLFLLIYVSYILY